MFVQSFWRAGRHTCNDRTFAAKALLHKGLPCCKAAFADAPELIQIKEPGRYLAQS
jgi:hypothetical protein